MQKGEWKALKIITIVNNKGGVAKTVTAVNLARILAAQKKKTLLIDLDQQANATQYLDCYGQNDNLGVSEVLFREKKPEEVTLQTKYKNLFIIPAHTKGTPMESRLRVEDILPPQLFLKKAMEKEKEKYDYIIIDCPPSVSNVTANALCFSTHAIIPVTPSEFALEGIGVVLESIDRVNSFYSDGQLDVIGVLYTKVEERLNITKHIIEQAEEMGIPILNTRIHKSSKVVESETQKEALYDYDKRGRATKDYIALAKEIRNMLEVENGTISEK